MALDDYSGPVLVSIIIVNFNTKELTRDCVNSVIQHTCSKSVEIIVVDNNSSDGSVEFLRDSFPGITVISNPRNVGFGAANNIAAKNAKGRYFFLLNSDTLLINNIVDCFVKFFEEHKNLKIGTLGSLLISNTGDTIHSFGKFPGLLRAVAGKGQLKKAKIDNLIGNTRFFEVDVVVGANMFMESETYKRFRGFDENIFLYEEELELQYRMRREGYLSLLIEKKGIIHLKGKSSSTFSQRKWSFASMCYIMKKHLPRYLYLLHRITWMVYGLVFFKNPAVSIQHKIEFLRLTMALDVPTHDTSATDKDVAFLKS